MPPKQPLPLTQKQQQAAAVALETQQRQQEKERAARAARKARKESAGATKTRAKRRARKASSSSSSTSSSSDDDEGKAPLLHAAPQAAAADVTPTRGSGGNATAVTPAPATGTQGATPVLVNATNVHLRLKEKFPWLTIVKRDAQIDGRPAFEVAKVPSSFRHNSSVLICMACHKDHGKSGVFTAVTESTYTDHVLKAHKGTAPAVVTWDDVQTHSHFFSAVIPATTIALGLPMATTKHQLQMLAPYLSERPLPKPLDVSVASIEHGFEAWLQANAEAVREHFKRLPFVCVSFDAGFSTTTKAHMLVATACGDRAMLALLPQSLASGRAFTANAIMTAVYAATADAAI